MSEHSAASGCCSIIILIALAIYYTYIGALPRHDIMDGYTDKIGTVTGSRWYYDGTSGSRNNRHSVYAVEIRYQYGGVKNVTTVQGQNYFQYTGGNMCKYVNRDSRTKRDAKNYARIYGQIGQTRQIFYRPSTNSRCSIEPDLTYYFKIGMTLFAFLGLFCFCVCFLATTILCDSGSSPEADEEWVALNSDMAITEGMRVEVMWPSIGGSLYKGRVTEATGYDNFSIAFDDGTTEANVVRARIVSYVAQKPQVPHSVSTSHGSTIIVDAIEDTTNTDAWLVAKVHQLDGPVESIHITVASIRDQGWGNTKGNVAIGLYRDQILVTRCNIFGTIRQDQLSEHAERTLSSTEPVVSSAQAHDVYKLEYTVGGGGGHELHVKNWVCTLTYSNAHTTHTVEVPPPVAVAVTVTDPTVQVIELGSQVEANYKGLDKWYPGTVCGKHFDGTFDVAYDFGESESFIPSARVRLAIVAAPTEPQPVVSHGSRPYSLVSGQDDAEPMRDGDDSFELTVQDD